MLSGGRGAIMNPLQHLAFVSVGRACAFGGLAIMTVMVALSYDPLLCARAGALLVSLMFFILRWRALRADRIDHRHSEVWALLDASQRPPKELAARLVRTAYREALLRFASYSLAIAAAFWVIVFAVRLWA
jgi:hypothetical protein